MSNQMNYHQRLVSLANSANADELAAKMLKMDKVDIYGKDSYRREEVNDKIRMFIIQNSGWWSPEDLPSLEKINILLLELNRDLENTLVEKVICEVSLKILRNSEKKTSNSTISRFSSSSVNDLISKNTTHQPISSSTTSSCKTVCDQLDKYLSQIKEKGNSDSLMKEIGGFCVNHVAFYRNLLDGREFLSPDEHRKIYMAFEAIKSEVDKGTATKLAEQLCELITKLSGSKHNLYDLLRESILLLPVNNSSLEEIRGIINLNKPIGYKLLAEWINNGKIALANLSLSTDEIKAIASQLKFVDIAGMVFDNAESVETFISQFPKVESLNVSSQPIRRLPSNLTKLENLNCSECHSLTALPSGMSALRKLICVGCTSLTSLPSDMSALQMLICAYCTSLTSLPSDMSALQMLFCADCTSLSSLSPGMSALQLLDCIDCTSLISLPSDMSALQILVCTGCTSLTSLPSGMSALQTLYCTRCTSLTSLPSDMSALKELYCTACKNLTSLPSGMYALQKLHCQNCTSLTLLPPDMPALLQIDSQGCTNLA